MLHPWKSITSDYWNRVQKKVCQDWNLKIFIEFLRLYINMPPDCPWFLGICIVHGSNIHDTISGLFRIWDLKNHFPATMHQYAAGIVKLELNRHSAPPTQLSQRFSTHEGDQGGLRDLGWYLNELRSTQNQEWSDLHIDIGRHSKQVQLTYAIYWHACRSRDVVKA